MVYVSFSPANLLQGRLLTSGRCSCIRTVVSGGGLGSRVGPWNRGAASTSAGPAGPRVLLPTDGPGGVPKVPPRVGRCVARAVVGKVLCHWAMLPSPALSFTSPYGACEAALAHTAVGVAVALALQQHQATAVLPAVGSGSQRLVLPAAAHTGFLDSEEVCSLEGSAHHAPDMPMSVSPAHSSCSHTCLLQTSPSLPVQHRCACPPPRPGRCTLEHHPSGARGLSPRVCGEEGSEVWNRRHSQGQAVVSVLSGCAVDTRRAGCVSGRAGSCRTALGWFGAAWFRGIDWSPCAGLWSILGNGGI